MESLLERAWNWRRSFVDRDAYRLFSGLPDGIPGLIIDIYGSMSYVHIYDKNGTQNLNEIILFLKHKNKSVMIRYKKEGANVWDLNQDFWAPKNPSWNIHELDCQLIIKPCPDNETGLYIDSHAARKWVAQNAHGQSVLNLFSFTCVFGVIAKKWGANVVTNVDVSHDKLTWGKENAKLNNVDFSVIPEYCQRYLERLIKRNKHSEFSLAIWDPPRFGAGSGGHRMLQNWWSTGLKQLKDLGVKTTLVLMNDGNPQVRGKQLALLHGIGKPQPIPQSRDVLGFLPEAQDPFYLPPEIFTLELNS